MIKFSNDFKWIMRISIGFALGFYIFYSMNPFISDKIGVYQTGRMTNEMNIVEREQWFNKDKTTYVHFLKIKKELNKKIADLEKRNEKLIKSMVAMPQAVDLPGSSGKKHELIDKLTQRLSAPTFVQIHNKLIDLETCSVSTKQVLFSWVQFLMLYSELELGGVQRDASML